MKTTLALIAALITVSPARATECYEQQWSNASSTSCDDGSRVETHGDTTTYTDPDGNDTTIERYGDRYYKSDGTVCSKTGSIWTCQ